MAVDRREYWRRCCESQLAVAGGKQAGQDKTNRRMRGVEKESSHHDNRGHSNLLVVLLQSLYVDKKSAIIH